MNTFKVLFAVMLAAFICIPSNAQEQTDPNHLKIGGYGYLITQTPQQTLWWAEGAYKVIKDAPIPQKKRDAIQLESAKNEWESFILISQPKSDTKLIDITLSDMVSDKYRIPASAFTIRTVEYINVTHPSDYYGFTGKWPDPIPTFKGNALLKKGENNPFWISLKTPEQAIAGQYKGMVTLRGEGWTEQIPVNLEVWDFTLPKSSTLRTAYDFNLNPVALYNNLKTDEEKEKSFEMHMKAYADYKLSPYNPFLLHPIKDKVSGVPWQGGFFDSKEKHQGKYSYMITDNSYNSNTEASLRQLLPIEGNKAYDLKWWAKAKDDKQPLTVGVECYDKNGELIWFENRFEEYRVGKEWKSFTLSLGMLKPEIANIMIRLYPSKRTNIGESLGTVWFDDITLTLSEKKEGAKAWVQGDDGVNKNSTATISPINEQTNLLACGNFEVDINKIDIELDFTDFKKYAKKYFGEYGFNGFKLILKGLGGGTYYSNNSGVFEGFAQGSDEYNVLMKRYLKQMQDGLEEAGVLGKEYIYWFDEPLDSHYPFIHETHAMIKKYAPKLTTFLTEHVENQDISDVTDISCTIWHKLNHKKIQKTRAKGQENWSYLCCWPKAPWITEFVDHDAINLRMWPWASYAHNLTGILIWATTYYNSEDASPVGKLQNPWDEAMCWVHGYGWVLGKQTVWGNSTGRYFYPENRDVNNDHRTYNNEVIPSLRLEILRDGIEDFEYFSMLEKLTKDVTGSKALKAKKLLQIPKSIYADEKTYTKDPQQMLKHRRKLAKAIVSLQNR